MSTQNPPRALDGTSIGTRGVIIYETNEPIVLLFIGGNSFRIGAQDALKLSADIANAASMASLQCTMRDWFKTRGMTDATVAELLKDFNGVVRNYDSDTADQSRDSITQARNAAEKNSLSFTQAPIDNISDFKPRQR